MAPKIVLIAHAQSLNNLSNKLHDPPLTNRGIEQCSALRQHLKDRFSNVADCAIISSPMNRTLQTAERAFDWLVEKGVKIEASADWQGWPYFFRLPAFIHDEADWLGIIDESLEPSNTGSPVSELKIAYRLVDFGDLDPIWPDKTSPAAERYDCTEEAIMARAEACLDRLCNRPEKVVFVVSHSWFLRRTATNTLFANAEYRVFDFADNSDKPTLELVQDESALLSGLARSTDSQQGLREHLDPESK